MASNGNAFLTSKTDIKIFILHLLVSVGCPLRFIELHDCAVWGEYIGSLAFTECFWELCDSGCIIELPPDENGDLRYTVSPAGREAATTLKSMLRESILDRSMRSALRFLSFRSGGGSIATDKEELSDGRWRVRCTTRLNGYEILDLHLTVDTSDRAEKIRTQFNERPEDITRAIFALLQGDTRFLLD